MSRTRHLAALIAVLPCVARLALPAAACCRHRSARHDAHATISRPASPAIPKKPARDRPGHDARRRRQDDAFDSRPASRCARASKSVSSLQQQRRARVTSSCSRPSTENRKHAEVMKKFPDMEHDDPNGKRAAAQRKARDRLEVHQARRIRIRLPDPRPPRSRHDRQGDREVTTYIEGEREKVNAQEGDDRSPRALIAFLIAASPQDARAQSSQTARSPRSTSPPARSRSSTARSRNSTWTKA